MLDFSDCTVADGKWEGILRPKLAPNFRDAGYKIINHRNGARYVPDVFKKGRLNVQGLGEIGLQR